MATDVEQHQALLEEALSATYEYPEDRFEGRGIVVCAGGPRLLTCAWVLVNVLRHTLDCRLPIELWHMGPEELGPIEESLFAGLGVTVVDAFEVRKSRPLAGGGSTLTIVYGARSASGPGAVAPPSTGPQTWEAQEKSAAAGVLTALAASPSITIS